MTAVRIAGDDSAPFAVAQKNCLGETGDAIFLAKHAA